MRLIFLMGIALLMQTAFAQSSSDLWTDVDEATIQVQGERQIIPQIYRTVQLNQTKLAAKLAAAPMEFTQAAPVKFNIPMPDGTMASFNIVESPIMEPGLMAKFPTFKAYAGQGVTDRTATIRLDVTSHGFHAMIIGNGYSVFIDPYSQHDTDHYISYFKKDFKRTDDHAFFELDPLDERENTRKPFNSEIGEGQAPLKAPTGELRTYRFAVAATGEYTAYHGGTVADGIAAIMTATNRVNEVYERDIAVRFMLIANNDLIVYTDGSTDPFTNNSAGSLINENQTVCDNEIGSANYDVGHNFSTGGGGLASLGVPCRNNSKARGVTGLGNPINDPFYIDYVAHEIGHQFGATHTFNGSSGSCSGNRTASTAYEPGSATTIMGYAGICSPQNVQSNSDDYFHAASLDQMIEYITVGQGDNCPVKTQLANMPPTADAGADFVIPASTPFYLTGVGSDQDGDAITFCWEQYDLGPQGAPNSPSGDATIFRSFDPTPSPTRYFPQLSDIVNNTQTLGEILPTYDRTMNFRLTVRDNRAGGGCLADDMAEVEVISNAGPFVVTNPNTPVTWFVGESQTITWDVANTNLAPISCTEVNIMLSTDGGYSYTTTLVANVANDGSQVITVPNEPSTTVRIQVVCADNIFFDISNENLSIEVPPTPTFFMTPMPTNLSVCAPDDAVFDLDIQSLSGFSDPVTFSVSGEPAGVSVSFTNNPVTPTAATQMTISNTTSGTPGNYTLTITGDGGGMSQSTDVELALFSGAPGTVNPTSPANNAQFQALNPTFTWAAATNAESYDIQVSTDVGFGTIVASATGLTMTSFTPSTFLSDNTTYYWHVRAVNGCAIGTYSTTYNFATSPTNCTTYGSTDVPINIPSNSATSVTSSFTINDDFIISDLNILNVTGTHTWINDLIISLTSPSNTTVTLLPQICYNQNNFNLNFDDEAANNNYPCPPTDGGTYQPEGNLSDFDGESSQGTWVLTIEDVFAQDGGTLQSWEIEVCAVVPPPTAPVLDIKVFLEGAYDVSSGEMTTHLTSELPLEQPYDRPPWEYLGAEIVDGSSNILSTVTDWVLIELRDATDNMVIVDQAAGLLLSNGTVVGMDEQPGISFPNALAGTPYYVVVRHRNHLAVISANQVVLPGAYDFTTAATQVLGMEQQVEVNPNVFALVAGDFDSDGVLTVTDFNLYQTQTALINVYVDGDADLNGNVTVTDFNLYQPNSSKIGVIEIRY